MDCDEISRLQTKVDRLRSRITSLQTINGDLAEENIRVHEKVEQKVEYAREILGRIEEQPDKECVLSDLLDVKELLEDILANL